MNSLKSPNGIFIWAFFDCRINVEKHALNENYCYICCNEIDMDAADILTKEVNERYELPDGHLYFTSINYLILNPLNFDPDLSNPEDDNAWDDGDREFLVYNLPYWHLDEKACIEPKDMGWYYCNYNDLINEYVPENNYFSHIEIWDEVALDPFDIQNNRYIHIANVYYGQAVLCPCPPAIPGGDIPTDCC